MGQKAAPIFRRNSPPSLLLCASEKQVAREKETRKYQELGGEHLKVDGLRGSRSTDADPLDQGKAVKVIIRERRLRDESFEPQLFSDPAWDILLDLYLAKLERRRVSVSSLCIAAKVPSTTALRYINWLVSRGLVERHPDELDGRVTFVEITEGGCSPMRDFLNCLPKARDRDAQ